MSAFPLCSVPDSQHGAATLSRSVLDEGPDLCCDLSWEPLGNDRGCLGAC